MLPPFKPKREPAKSIFEAFQRESAKRDTNKSDWIQNERKAVFDAATKYATERGIKLPTMAMVEEAEQYACGHTDYGAKWAYKLAGLMEAQTTYKRDNWTNEEVITIIEGFKLIPASKTNPKLVAIADAHNTAMQDLIEHIADFQRPPGQSGALAMDTKTKVIYHIGRLLPS